MSARPWPALIGFLGQDAAHLADRIASLAPRHRRPPGPRTSVAGRRARAAARSDLHRQSARPLRVHLALTPEPPSTESTRRPGDPPAEPAVPRSGDTWPPTDNRWI